MTKKILEKIETLESKADDYSVLKRILHMLKDKTNTIMHMLDEAPEECPSSSETPTTSPTTSPSTTTTSDSSTNPDLRKISQLFYLFN